MPSIELMKMLAEKFEKGELNFLEDESEFVFSCEQCGKCCRNREDIVLSPHDFFHMVKGTGKDPQEVIERYTNVYVGDSSHMTVMQLRYRIEFDRQTTCYFLGRKDEKYYCRIQDYKPFVCRAYPLGRATVYAQNDQEFGEKAGRYFLQDIPYDGDCIGARHAKSKNIKHRVIDWLGGKEKKEASERYNSLFNKFCSKLYQTINLEKLSSIPSRETYLKYYNMMFFLFYLKYDFSGSEDDFLEQYEKNIEDLFELSKVLVSAYPKLLKPKAAKK